MYKEPGKYSRLREYKTFLRVNFQEVKELGLNRFYCYDYAFKTHYKMEDLKWFDLCPVGYAFRQNKTHIWCLNFHHMSTKGREIWLEKVKKLSKSLDEALPFINFDNTRLYRIPSLNYPKIIQVLKKAKIGIRCYRKEAIFNARKVPLAMVSEIFRYHARTYFNVPYKAVAQKYSNYRP